MGGRDHRWLSSNSYQEYRQPRPTPGGLNASNPITRGKSLRTGNRQGKANRWSPWRVGTRSRVVASRGERQSRQLGAGDGVRKTDRKRCTGDGSETLDHGREKGRTPVMRQWRRSIREIAAHQIHVRVAVSIERKKKATGWATRCANIRGARVLNFQLQFSSAVRKLSSVR